MTIGTALPVGATGPEWITAIVAAAAAIASGTWAFTRWVADRADARKQARELAEERLRQQAIAEQHRREDRAAELVVKLGEASTPEARRWVAGALALYPAETTKLLVNSLGHAEDAETASTITLTLASIGPSVLPEILRAHRLARTVVAIEEGDEGDPGAAADVFGARGMLRCTRRVIAHLMLEMSDDDRAAVDLAGVDLSGVNFAGADLERANLRKAVLDRVIFARAKLKGGNFRGARVSNAVFTRAQANGADFTGLIGPIVAIRLFAEHATVQDAKLDRSRLDAARFGHSTFLRASLVGASSPGAVFDDAEIRRCHWDGIDLRKASARRAALDGVRLGKSVLAQANFSACRIVGSRLTGADAAGIVLSKGELVDCNLGGVEFVGADLRGATFTRCNLNSANLEKADLRGARFKDCQFFRTAFSTTKLAGAVFEGLSKTHAETLVVAACWEDAVFEDQELRKAFAVAATVGH